jgi:hypothetical protein
MDTKLIPFFLPKHMIRNSSSSNRKNKRLARATAFDQHEPETQNITENINVVCHQFKFNSGI